MRSKAKYIPVNIENHKNSCYFKNTIGQGGNYSLQGKCFLTFFDLALPPKLQGVPE